MYCRGVDTYMPIQQRRYGTALDGVVVCSSSPLPSPPLLSSPVSNATIAPRYGAVLLNVGKTVDTDRDVDADVDVDVICAMLKLQ